jgi:type VI secretion system protein ImpF
MRESPRHESLKPSLLDRLTDEDPASKEESRSQRVLTPTRYLEGVLRDLRWLLNTRTHLLDTPVTARPVRAARSLKGPEEPGNEMVLGDFPEVSKSVLAYGVPDLSGVMTANLIMGELSKTLEEAIRVFEPRVNPSTLRVRPLSDLGDRPEGAGLAIIGFEIKADVFMDPIPEHLHLKTIIDLETGECQFADTAHGPQVS